ncbi:M48 family metalloprotease, partial [Accumulibacter sp.]|uniref:M48 family metalloprotease n=1 Tax=Accumulibacter sp. TaxID=2053492 RepID=UPI002D166D97
QKHAPAMFRGVNFERRLPTKRGQYSTPIHRGVHDFGDPAVIPVAILVLSSYFLVMTPVVNTVIRTQEQEADVFGLNAARAPDGFAKIAMKLSTYRKIEPGKWEEIIFFDHPSGRTRVTTAMQWKAEHLGEPGVE